MIEYHPNLLSIDALNKEFLGVDLVNECDEQRLQDVADKKKRRKGTLKKSKFVCTS